MLTHTVPYMHSPETITVFLSNLPYSFTRDSVEYEQIARALYAGNNTEDTENELKEIIDSRSTAFEKRWDAITEISDRLTVIDDVIHWDGEPMHNTLAVRLLALIKAGHTTEPQEAFQANLEDNPDYRVRQCLFDFLEVGKVPLTSDGCFLAYKYVNENYLDAYSRKFDNSIGAVVSMPRRDVDPDPNNTCSAGLHVCSYSYLGSYTPSHRIMVCKINPRDVVAIPADYNNTKMRVCEYEVVGEVTDFHKEDRNILSERPFNDSYDGDDEDDDSDENSFADIEWNFDNLEPTGMPNLRDFAEPGRYELLNEYYDRLDSYDTLSDAITGMQQYLSDDCKFLRIIDTKSGDAIFKADLR